MQLRQTLGWLAVMFCCGIIAGCGDGRPQRVPVSGIVTIDGKPVTSGNIRFVPANDRPASGKIGPDGHFTLSTYDPDDGCVLGKHKVTVGSDHLVGPNAIEYLVPKAYYDEKTSTIAPVEITGPTDNLEIKLTWGGGRPFVERVNTTGDVGVIQ